MNDWSVRGIKLTESEKILDQKGNVIWDGQNEDILLCSLNLGRDGCLLFAQQIKRNVGKSWKIYITNKTEEIDVN